MVEHDVANVEDAGSRPVCRSHGPQVEDTRHPPAKRDQQDGSSWRASNASAARAAICDIDVRGFVVSKVTLGWTSQSGALVCRSETRTLPRFVATNVERAAVRAAAFWKGGGVAERVGLLTRRLHSLRLMGSNPIPSSARPPVGRSCRRSSDW